MSNEVKIWLSAGELALLGDRSIAGLPRTMQGCKWRAKKDGWMSREVKCMGGKAGMRTEYQPPANVLALIQSFLAENPEFLKPKRVSKSSTTTEVIKRTEDIGGDESARQAAALLDPQHEDRLRMLTMVIRMSEARLVEPPTPDVAKKIIDLVDAWLPFGSQFSDMKERLEALRATAALFV